MLERICLKAIARRASDRYGIAQDLAEDLRHYLATDNLDSPSQARAPGTAATSSASTPSTSNMRGIADSKTGMVNKVVPKGLRSFDSMDAEFFVSLLPGPKDRNGLPESIRFWRNWISKSNTDAASA